MCLFDRHAELPNHMRRGGQDNSSQHYGANNRPQMLTDAAHRTLQHSLAATNTRGGYNPYTGGYTNPPGWGGPMAGYRGPHGPPQPMMGLGQGRPQFTGAPMRPGYGQAHQQGNGVPGYSGPVPMGHYSASPRPMTPSGGPRGGHYPYGSPMQGGPVQRQMGGPQLPYGFSGPRPPGQSPPGPIAPHQRVGMGGNNPFSSLQRPAPGRGGQYSERGGRGGYSY